MTNDFLNFHEIQFNSPSELFSKTPLLRSFSEVFPFPCPSFQWLLWPPELQPQVRPLLFEYQTERSTCWTYHIVLFLQTWSIFLRLIEELFFLVLPAKTPSKSKINEAQKLVVVQKFTSASVA